MIGHPAVRLERRVTARGYVQVNLPEHPRAYRGWVWEHVLVVSEAMGKPLPRTAVVHHINGDTTDNRPENLVACNDQAYHLLLHRREREAKGQPHPGRARRSTEIVRCSVCREMGPPDTMVAVTQKGRGVVRFTHRACTTKHNATWKDRAEQSLRAKGYFDKRPE